MYIIDIYQHNWRQSLFTTKALDSFLSVDDSYNLYRAQPDGGQYWELAWLESIEAARKAATEATLVAVRRAPFSVELDLQARSKDSHEVALSLGLEMQIRDPRQFALEWLRQHQQPQALTLKHWLPELTNSSKQAWQISAAQLDYSELAKSDLAPQLKVALAELVPELKEIQIIKLHSASAAAEQRQQAEIELQRQEAERTRQQEEIKRQKIAESQQTQAAQLQAETELQRQRQQAEIALQRQRQQAESELEQERKNLQHKNNISEQERHTELHSAEIASKLKIAEAELPLAQKELEIAQLRQQTQQINAATSERDQSASAENLAILERRFTEQQAYIKQLQRSYEALQEAIQQGIAPEQPEIFSQSQGGYSEETPQKLEITEFARCFHSWCSNHSSSDFTIKHKSAQTKTLGNNNKVNLALIGDGWDFSMELKDDHFLAKYLTLICVGIGQSHNVLHYPCRRGTLKEPVATDFFILLDNPCNSFVADYYANGYDWCPYREGVASDDSGSIPYPKCECKRGECRDKYEFCIKEKGPEGRYSIIALLSTELLLSDDHIRELPQYPEAKEIPATLEDHQLRHIFQSAKNLVTDSPANLLVACFDYEVRQRD